MNLSIMRRRAVLALIVAAGVGFTNAAAPLVTASRMAPVASSVQTWIALEAQTLLKRMRTPEAMLDAARRDVLARFSAQNATQAQRDAIVILVMQQINADSSTDQLSEMSQSNSMRMQQYMDRKAKLEQMLSNLMKASADTSQSIISNLK